MEEDDAETKALPEWVKLECVHLSLHCREARLLVNATDPLGADLRGTDTHTCST